jgi:glycosyltransferase involved in cell wall biosynthesis
LDLIKFNKTNALKILFPFVGDSIGGSHLSTLELYKTLREHEYDVVVLLHKSDGPLSKLLKKSGVEYLEIKTVYLSGESPNIAMILYGMILNIPPFVKFILKNNIDIVHGNDLRVNLTWSIAAKISKIKFIWHQRTILSNSKLWRFINLLCDHFIGISHAVINSAPKNISPFKRSLVYNAFDTDTRFDKSSAKNLINKGSPKIQNNLILGCVGRLVPYKNIDFVIRCIPEIITTSKVPIHLLVVGSGPDEYTTYLKNIVKDLDLHNNVTFTGFLDNPSKIISGLDILIAPSSRDAFGRTIIEAMLQSTTVLVADKGGHLEIVEDGFDGLIYPANCKKSFIEKIFALTEDKALRQMLASNALDKSISKYSKKSLFLAVEKIYKSVTALKK